MNSLSRNAEKFLAAVMAASATFIGWLVSQLVT